MFDPFAGSGTSIAAAEVLQRTGCGVEISPAYCDVVIHRIAQLSGETAVLAETGETFAIVARSRGVDAEQTPNPKRHDSRAIKHHGPNPHYGPRRKAS